ncbi:hypothetical protein B0T09DRAFT_182239 [Sordaria sp. MPI-SDFR-AT-0083]|nr:hypothetical protein B0T09DRAFT_182239 [Sordaria sp. MPI-SDFR-AT-0083]
MIPRDQRRRSPERERRRRADRRHSREQLAAAALAAATVGQQTAAAGPSSSTRSRANSSTSSSAVTSSDEDSAPKNTGWGFRSFFSLASSKKVRKRRSFRKKNYSSSSVDSNLAYGGYQSRSSLESQRGVRRRSGPQRKISQTYSQHSHHDKEYQQHKDQPKDQYHQPKDQYNDHQQYEPQHEYQRPEYVPQNQYAPSDQTTPRPYVAQPQYAHSDQTTPRPQHQQQPHAHPEPYYRHQHQQYHQQQPHGYQHPSQYHHDEPEHDPELFTPDGRPNLARTKTDEEIIELGRKISDLARASNLRDLERAGKQRPSQLVGAATAISNFRRQNSRRNGRRGLAPSKFKRNEQNDDDQGWDTASDSDSDSGDNTEEASASDSDLAYGSSPHYSDDKLSSPPAAAPPPPTISPQKPYVRNKAVDPSKFGPVNSLHGLVTPLNSFRPTENAPPPRQSKPWLNRFENDPLPEHPTPADELDTPMQMVYPVATPDPHRFDAVTSPTLVSGSPLITSRPVAVAIQAPKPRVPVSTRALEQHQMPRQRSADGRHLVADSALAKSIGTAANKHEVIRDDTPPSNYRQHRSRASDMSTGSAHPSHASHHSQVPSHHSHTSHTSHVPVHVQVPLPTTRDLEFDDWHDFEDRHNRLASDVPKFTDPAAAGVAATLIGTALFQDRHRRDDEEERSLDPNHVLAEYKARVQQEEEQRRKVEEAEKERLEKERQEREARAAAAIKREREAREAQEAAEREAREKKEAEERAAAAALQLAVQREREEREAREALEKMQREAEERAAAAAAAQRELEALEKARREAQEREVQEAIEKARREAMERAAAAEERERQEREHLQNVRREAEDLAIAARRELETRESAIEAVAKEARRLRDEADYREQYERRVREAREMQYKEERRMHDARYRAERDNMVVDIEPRHRSTSRQSRDESPEEKRSDKGKEIDREEHHRPKPQPVTIINERDVPKDEPKPKVEEPTRSVPGEKRESMGDTLNPEPKKPSKEERRAKRAETRRLLAEMQKELELEKERARKLAELEAAEQQQKKPKEEEPRKSSPPVVPESSKLTKDQVPDDAFATPVYATPARPLTPQVHTVPEPDFSPPKRRQVTRQLTDQELEVRERITRRDTFEIEKRQEEIRRSRNASEQPTGDYFDPRTASEADMKTLTPEGPERERSRSRNRAGSRVRESEPLRDITEEPGRARSRSRQPSYAREAEPKPDPQVEANKWYRDYKNSQRNERLRSSSPNRSVVDKYEDSKSEPSSPVIVTAEPTIITAEPKWVTVEPADDGKPAKSKYAEPNADVKIDHVILPRDLHKFLTPSEDHASLHAPAGKPMFSSRDPSCERERPLLTLVLPTPAPTPNPERQRRERERQAAREPQTGPIETKPTSEDPKPAPVAADESKKPNYILNARGEIEIIAPTPKDEDNESVKSDGWVEPVADTGLTHVVADRSRQAAVEAIKRALLQPKKERKASSAWGALGGALLKKVAEDRKAAAEKKAELPAAEEKSAAPEVEEQIEVPASVVEAPIVEEQKLRELEPETKPAEVVAPTKTEVQPDVELPRQALHPAPEPHPEPHHDAPPVPTIAIQEPESPKTTEETKYDEPKEEPKDEGQSALPEGDSHEEKRDEAMRQIVDEQTSSPVKPKRKLPKGVVEPPIFSPYRPTFSDNFADVLCGENPNPDTHADTYTWRRDGVALEPETQTSSTSEEWESLPREVEIDKDETTTNPKRTFNPDNREPPDRLGKEFSFEVVDRENSQTYPSDESAREGEKVTTEHSGVSDRRPSHEFADFPKNQTNGSTSGGKHDHIITTTTELNGNHEEQSFLGNAGTHGAGAGSAEDSEAATASESKEAEAQILPRPNATQASMGDIPVAKAKEEKEEEKKKKKKKKKSHDSNNAGSDSAPEPAQQLRHTDSRFIDPEVLVHRSITPAIDPQYGDLLPLPPYPTLTGPGYRYLEDLPSPLDLDLEQLPALPESRPSTPPPTSASRSSSFKAAVAAMMGTQSMVKRQRGHTRSRSALDGTTPVRVPSQTAVPIQFRLKGKRSGSVHSLPPPEAWGQSPVSRPSSAHGDPAGVSGGTSPVRSRPRPSSWESSMREMKPLYLVERNAAVSGSAPARVIATDTDEALPPPESFELPDDDDLDLLPALPESVPGSVSGSDAGSPLVAPQIENLGRNMDVPSEDEEEVLKPVEVDLPTTEPETEAAVEAALPAPEVVLRALPVTAPETVKLPVDEDLDLLPALPESDAGSPIIAPADLSRDVPVDEVLNQVEVEVPSPAPAERTLPALGTVKLPVDEDLDLLPALPESPTFETAVPVAVLPVTVPAEGTLPAPEEVKLPVDEDLDLLPALPESPITEAAVPASLPAVTPEVIEVVPAERELHLPSPETVKLPVDEDLDLLPALPESPTIESAVPISIPAVTPEVVEAVPVAEPEVVEALKAIETPAPVEREIRLPSPETVKLPIDEDLDLLPALPDSGCTSPTLREPASLVSVGESEDEAFASPTEDILPAPQAVKLPEDIKLPVDEDLDLLPELPDSPAIETMPSIPVSAPEEEETPKTIERPQTIELPVTIAPAPETVKLPVDKDLDLLPALPDSLATSPITETMPNLPFDEEVAEETPKTVEREVPVPESIKLPVDEDLDLLPALPDSIATSRTPATMPTLPNLAPEVADAPKEIPVAPETITLPADDDLDLLPALPASGNTSPERSTSPVLEKAASPVIVPVPEPEAETVALPVDEDLDLLPALPESGPASPTKEYSSLATSPVIAPAVEREIDNGTKPVPDVSRELEVSKEATMLEPEPETISLPVDDDLDLLPSLPESGPASPTKEHASLATSPVVAPVFKPAPETVCLPVDEDLDLLPALPESGLASPTKEHTSHTTSPVASPALLKEIETEAAPILTLDDEVAKELLPKPETVSLPVDEDLDLLPALPESGPASPTKEHFPRSASPVAPVLEKEPVPEATSEVTREVIPEPEAVSLPVDEDLDLLPALPESIPASPTKEYASIATSPVVEAVIEKEPIVEAAPEVVPERLPLPIDQDLDLLPALPESVPASPTKEHASLATSPVIEAVVEPVVEKEPVVETIADVEVVPELLPLPVNEDLDLLPALPESAPASPTKGHASLATSPVIEAVVEKEPATDVIPVLMPLPIDQDLDLLPALPESAPASPTKGFAFPVSSSAETPESVPEAVSEEIPKALPSEVIPELLPLPKAQDLDLLPVLPESGPSSPTKEFAFPVSSPAETLEAVPEDNSKVISEVNPELLPLPRDQDLDLLPALPDSGPSSPVSRDFATPVAQPKDIPVIEEIQQPSKASEDVLSITTPQAEFVPLPAESDDGLWALPSLPQSRAGSGYTSPVTATFPTDEVSPLVKAIEEISELPISVNPETVRLPSDDGLWALPSLPGSPEGLGYASPVAAMPALGVEPPMRDLEEYFPDSSDQETVEEVPSKLPVGVVATELPLDTLPQLPADENLDLLPALPDSRSESPEIAQPSTPKVEETIPEEVEKAVDSPAVERSLPVPESVSLPVDEDLDLLPELPESRGESPELVQPSAPQIEKAVDASAPEGNLPESLPLLTDEDLDLLPELPQSRSDSPTAQPSAPKVEQAVIEEAKKAINVPDLERKLPESVSLPTDEDLDFLPQLPESRSSSPGYELQVAVPETEETAEKTVYQPEQLPLPTDEDLDLLPQLPESRSSSPGYELPVATPEIEQEQPTIDNVAKDIDLVQPQEPTTPALSELPSLPADEDLDLLPELPASRDSSPDLAVSLPVEDQEVLQAEEDTSKQLALSGLPALPVDEDLELLPVLPESRNESPEPEASVPASVPEQADLSKLPALPIDEDLDILPALPESRNESPEPQPISLPKAISPEVLPLPADEDLDLLPELPESRGSTPDQEAAMPVAAPESPVVEEAVKNVPEVAEDLSKLPALPVDEDLDILPALPDSPAVDNFPEEETQTSQLLEEVFTQPAWEETQPTQFSDIVDEEFAPIDRAIEVSKDDLSQLPALPESRSDTPLSDLPALPESRSSSRSEDIETAPSLEDPSELPPLPESREDSPEPKSPLPVLGTQPDTESLAKQVAPGQSWNEGETQEEAIPTSNEIIVGHVRRNSSEAAHPGDIYEKPSSHNQAKSPMLIGNDDNNDPNEIDYKLAETIYEDMCEDDASTVAASDAPSFLSGANAEQKEQIAKALAGDSEATSSLSPESSFRVLQYLKKRDAAMKQGQTYEEEPEEVVPGPSSQYEDEEEQVPQEIEEAVEATEEIKKSKGVSFVSPEASESEPTPPASEKPTVLEDAPTDEDIASDDQSTPRQELRIGIPGPSSRVANLEAVNDELENIPGTEEAQEEQEEEPSKALTDEDKCTESASNQEEESSGEPQPQPGSILGGGLVAEPERQPRPKRVSSPDDQWGTLGDLDDLDDEDDDVSEYSPGGTNMKRYSLTRLPTFPGVTAFLGRNFRSNSEPNPHPSDVPVQDERDYYSSDEREMLEEEQKQDLLGEELERRLEDVKVDEKEDEKEKSEEVEGADESQTVPEPEKPTETEPEPAQETLPTKEPESIEKKAPEVEEPKEPELEAEPETKEAVEPEAAPTSKPKKNGPGLDRHSTWPVVKSDTVPSEKKTAPESESTEEEAPAPKESTTDNENTTTTTTTTLLPEETPLPKSGDLSPTDVGPQPPTPTATDEALPEATGLDTNPQIQDSLDSAAESRHLPSESLTPLPDRQDTTEPEPTETASQEDEDATTTTNAIEREPEPETETPTAKQEEATTADGKQGESQTDDKEKSQEEPKTEEQPATVSPDLASPTSETFTPRLLRRSTAKKEKIKAGKMSNPASPTMGAGWGIASPPALSLDKALEAADPFSAPDLERRMRTVSATTREAERSAKIAEKEKLERALFLQRRSTFDNVANSPTSSTHNSVLGSTSSVAVETGSIGEERPAYALKRASTDRAEKKKKPAAEKKKSRKSDWPDAWPEDFDEEATMPQESGHPSMWPELHGRASPSPIRGRSGYRTPTPLGQYIEVRECGGMTGDDSADSVGVLQDGGPKDIPPPEPIPEVPSKPIPDVGSDTATPSSVTNKELGGTIKASGKKGRKRRSSSLAVPTDKEEDANIHNSEAEQGDLDTQPSGSAPGTKTKKNKRTRKGKGKATDSSPAANAEDAEGQEASDGDEEPSSGNAQDANAGAAGDALGKKKRKKNKKKGSQTPSGLMSPPLEPNPEVAQLTAQLAQLTDLVQQLVVEKTRSPSVDPDTQSRSRRSSSVTKGNPKIRRTSSGGGGDGETLYDSDGFSIHDEDEELGDDNNETVAADETTKAKRFMGVPYRRGSKSKSDKGGEKGDKAKDKHQQQSSSQSTTSTTSSKMNLGIPKLGLNSLLGGKSSSSGPKEMSTQTSSPEPSPRNSFSKDGDEEVPGSEDGPPDSKKYPPSASKPVKSKVRRAMSGLSRTRGAPSLEQIPETEFEDSELEDGASSPGPKPGMLNRAMTGMSLDKLDFRKPRSSSVGGETDRRPATATDAESINMETASITQPKGSAMMKRAFSGMIPTTSKPRASLDQSETESISGARPSMMKRAVSGMIPGAAKPRSSMDSTAEHSGERKMSMGSAFKNFSMGGKSSREASRTREPTSRGPSIDLGPRETDSAEISPHESPAVRAEVLPDPHLHQKPGMMKRALTGMNPAASRPEMTDRRESEPVLEKEKHKTLDRLTFGMMSRSHATPTGVGTQTPDSGFNSTPEQDLLEPSRPGSGSGSGSSSIHHHQQQQQSSEKSKTNKTMKMLGLGAFTKKDKNPELVETPPETSRPGSSGSHQTTAAKPSRLDRTISGMSLSRPRKSISQETSPLDADSRPGTGSSMQPPQQPQFAVRPDPSPAPKSRMASFNKVMTLGLIKDKSEKTPTPSHHEPETATQTPMESSASAHSNGSRPTSWNSNQFPENPVLEGKPSKPQTRMGRAMSALSIPTSRNSVSQERPASSYPETTTSTNLTEPTDVTDSHSHHSHQSNQTATTVTDSKKEKSKMSFKSVVTLGMASSSRSSSSRRQSVEHGSQTQPQPPTVQQPPAMPKLELPSFGLGDSLLGSPPGTSSGLSPPPIGSTSAPPTSYGFPSMNPETPLERQKDLETASMMNQPKPGMLSRTKTAMSIGSRKDWNDSAEAGEMMMGGEKKKVMSSSAKANWNRALMGTKGMGKMGMGGMFGKKKEKEKDRGV